MAILVYIGLSKSSLRSNDYNNENNNNNNNENKIIIKYYIKPSPLLSVSKNSIEIISDIMIPYLYKSHRKLLVKSTQGQFGINHINS